MTTRWTAAFALIVASLATRVHADECPQPIYQGMKTGALMRFLGNTGELVEQEHGTIETNSPRHIFSFTTTHSNGFSREYLILDKTPAFKMGDVDSVVIRKNRDFTDAEEPGAFLLTPDLPVKLYYATNVVGQEALHAVRLDDTWKLIGCGGPYSGTPRH